MQRSPKVKLSRIVNSIFQSGCDLAAVYLAAGGNTRHPFRRIWFAASLRTRPLSDAGADC